MPELQSWSNEQGQAVSPGGFDFGVQGWVWATQTPKSITFYLDNTAAVHDQYGRPIKGLHLDNGKDVMFATLPPRQDGTDLPIRKVYASHAEIVAALAADLRIDVIQEMNDAGTYCERCRGTAQSGGRQCQKCKGTGVKQVITCAGWPQLPYDDLKRLKTLPTTPIVELEKIRDAVLRKDALRIRREADEAVAKENAAEKEDDE